MSAPDHRLRFSAFQLANAGLGRRTLVESALVHATRGVTSLEEVMRVAGERAPDKLFGATANERSGAVIDELLQQEASA